LRGRGRGRSKEFRSSGVQEHLGISPHKAHECAFDEKHPVLRVGDAEGAVRYAENRLRTSEADRGKFILAN
jgi:hypothetical protein